MMGQPDDAELMRRWQGGDLAAFATLVVRWQQPVARFLARLTNAHRAADLCQETFLRVLRSADRYRERGNFSTWLFQVALNVARDAGRRNRPVPTARRGESAEAPDVLCERDELAIIVAESVAQLPETLREVLALRHDADLNFEQMARLLGTPASTLKSRFAAALSRLRVQLHERGYTAEETLP